MLPTFKEWFLEGTAYLFTQDQEAFLKEAINAVNQWFTTTPDEQKDQLPEIGGKILAYPVLYEREVYGKTRAGSTAIVDAKLRIGKMENPSTYGLADRENTGNVLIGIFKFENNTWGLPPNLDSLLRHEFTHAFDPKMSLPSWETDNWQAMRQKSQRPYFNNPFEQDAKMHELAVEKVQRMKANNQPFNGRLQASSQTELDWYRNPTMWRRYLNTIYKIWNNTPAI
jgi:hypothetical protein